MESPLLLATLLAASLLAASAGFVGNPTPATDKPETRTLEPHAKAVGWQADSLLVSLNSAVTVSVSSYSFTANPSTFTVSWSGVPSPSGQDVIGVWSPGELPANAAAPIMWLSANVSGYLTSGSGSVNFTFYNFRNNYIFRLVSGNTVFPNPTVIAESPLVMNMIPNMPSQVHLSVATNKSYVVQWVSNTTVPTMLKYGMLPDALTHKSMSTAVTYTKDMMCGGPAQSTAFTHPGWTHTAIIDYAVIRNVKTNNKIYYQVGDATNGMTSVMYFHKAPEVGSNEILKFVIFNDVGSSSVTLFNDTCACTNTPLNTSCSSGYIDTPNPDGKTHSCCGPYCPAPSGTPANQTWYLTIFSYTPNAVKLAPVLVAEEKATHMAILNGDLSYAQGYTDSWDTFGHMMEPAFTMWPVMTGLGNHERDWPGTGDAFDSSPTPVLDSGGECGVAYTYRYYNPGPGALLDPRSSYYKFAMGSVSFLVLDTETPSDAASPQGMWVKKALASINYKKTPWVVVSTHRMMNWMSTDTRPVQGDLAVSQRLLSDLEDEFHGKVHFVVAGHQHAYGRTCAVYKGNCTTNPSATFIKNPKAPIYILAGNAGAGFTKSFPAVPPTWVPYAFQFINGYVRFEADMDTITMQAIAADPLGWQQTPSGGPHSLGTGAVFDSVTLSK